MRKTFRAGIPIAKLLAAALMAAPAAAQSVSGTLTQEDAALAGVRVVLLDGQGAASAETVTDVRGRFTLTAPGPGSWRVRAEPAGRAPILSPVLPLAAGQTREFRMRALPGVAGPVAAASHERGRAVAVSGVTATAREAARDGRLRDFYQRARGGGGRFLTREDIERLRPRTVPDLLRNVPGLVIVNDGAGAQVLSTGARPNALGRSGSVLGGSRAEAHGGRGGGGGGGAAGGGGGSGGGEGGGDGGTESDSDPEMTSTTPQCRVAFYVDGVYLNLAMDENITAHVTPDQIEGVEVYARAAMVPSRYQRLNNDCGAVLIWTRER